MTHEEFPTIELAQLEQVAGGGKIARKIKKALKKIFSDVTFEIGGDLDANFTPSDPEVSVEFG